MCVCVRVCERERERTRTRERERELERERESCVEIRSAPSNAITKSGRAWRKVPESEARSVESGAYTL